MFSFAKHDGDEHHIEDFFFKQNEKYKQKLKDTIEIEGH
jgi:hypothetical protein